MGGFKQKKIYVAGHQGMVGSAILRQLRNDGESTVVVKTRQELDLVDQSKLHQFLNDEAITEVYLCAAKVGGIHANSTYPADFIYSNLVIETNLVHGAYLAGINRILFLGSSCIYPKHCSQPMKESALLSGELESTNESYAIAKIAGIKLCESYNRQYGTDYRSVMPTNLYGPNDNFHPRNSHVVPALLQRFHEAKQQSLPRVTIWGTGSACREFLFVDDMAEACVFVMNLPPAQLNQAVTPTRSHLNIGTGKDVSIKELAETVARVVGYDGALVFDSSMPDGTPRKLLDVSTMTRLGWKYRMELEEGLQLTYKWYCDNQDLVRRS
jgi:GDP-L-fucose synthase